MLKRNEKVVLAETMSLHMQVKIELQIATTVLIIHHLILESPLSKFILKNVLQQFPIACIKQSAVPDSGTSIEYNHLPKIKI